MSASQTTPTHPGGRGAARPPEGDDLAARVDRLLRDGKPATALPLVSGSASPWARNARGVCLLRLGRAAEAIESLRDLVFDPTSLSVRADADPLHRANYAIALLLDGNAEGFFGVLGDIPDRGHPAVVKLTDAVRRWRAGMTFGQRLRSLLGIGGPPFVLDSPPGDL